MVMKEWDMDYGYWQSRGEYTRKESDDGYDGRGFMLLLVLLYRKKKKKIINFQITRGFSTLALNHVRCEIHGAIIIMYLN